MRNRIQRQRWPRRKVITGCEARGDGDSPYLIRYDLFKSARLKRALYLHIFVRNDAEDYHCHPWDFTTIVLWGGYVERFPDGSSRLLLPGMILKRRAELRHRVELVNGRKAVTLVLTGPVRREWYFWTALRCVPIHFKEYFERFGC